MMEQLRASSLLSASKELPIQDVRLVKLKFSQKLLFNLILQQSLLFYTGLSTSHASYITPSLEFGELTDHIC